MWKDWLSFTRKEQLGIILLTIFIFLFLLVRLAVAFWDEPPKITTNVEVEDFFEKTKVETSKKSNEKEKYAFDDVFNPNEVDVTTLDEMGFSPFVVVNWMKYLEAGGRFYSLSDVGKVYGLDSTALKKMEPYVDFGSSGSEDLFVEDHHLTSKDSEKNSKQPEAVVSGKRADSDLTKEITLDINTATAEDFKKIRGIGDVYSKRIVDFRNLLGGFYSVDQIMEVYGISEELFNDIRKSLDVKDGPFRKLEINKASLRELKAHPYVSFYQARDIVECRKKTGKIKDAGMLEEFSSFDDEKLKKILPYLRFE